MQHFSHLPGAAAARLFEIRPRPFKASDAAATVGHALGATLYMPATRSDLTGTLQRARRAGLVAAVVCLEDAVRDQEVELAQARLVAALVRLAEDPQLSPLVFVRVRWPEQVVRLVRELGPSLHVVSGFVYPKFSSVRAEAYLDAHRRAAVEAGRPLWFMPILETPEVANPATRIDELVRVRGILEEVREHVPAVRVGLTDIAGEFGVRRPRDLTAYDLPALAAAIGDVVGVLCRGDTPFVVSGPVWEHFPQAERLWKPQLRESPFRRRRSASLRADLLARDLDGLIREAHLDQVQGMLGKTVIHPSHVAVVNALSVVSYEEHRDALSVLGPALCFGGAAASPMGNKMNEGHPHRRWAERLLRRADAFGVARPDVGFVDLLTESLRV